MNSMDIAEKLAAGLWQALITSAVELKSPAALQLAEAVSSNESPCAHALAVALATLGKPDLIALFRNVYAAEGQTLVATVGTPLH
jgi:HPt (histidine-containing phosphotransfer) domain-containing protein